MTEKPTFGRALGETARKVGKLHHRALADFDTDFPGWMLLTLLKDKGMPVGVDELVRELGLRADLAGPVAIEALERAVAAGHVTAGDAALTEAGAEYFASVYAHARKTTDAAMDGIDPALLDIALTVLMAIDRRAAELAA